MLPGAAILHAMRFESARWPQGDQTMCRRPAIGSGGHITIDVCNMRWTAFKDPSVCLVHVCFQACYLGAKQCVAFGVFPELV